MSHHLSRAIKYLQIKKSNGVSQEHRTPGIRLYCEQHASRWGLQLRGQLALANGSDGRDFVIAHANLSREDMTTLRDSIDTLLAEDA